MKTLYLTNSDRDIQKAAEIIRAGGLVAFPTETVYGLGGNALSASAAGAIYAAKGRPSDNPLIVHIARAEELFDVAECVPAQAQRLADSLWPGPLTMVLRKRGSLPYETTGGLDTVAIRCPANETARKLIEYAGLPIAAPSANLSGRPSPTAWQHVRDDMDGRIDAVIMAEPCSVGIESTIVDMTGLGMAAEAAFPADDTLGGGAPSGLPLILRPGLISPETISEITGLFCGYDDALSDSALAPKAPGMKYKHYSPKADMTLYSGAFEAVKSAMENDARMLEAQNVKVVSLVYEDAQTAAKMLFADLRRADEAGAERILAAALSGGRSLDYSVMNRMLKAAGYKIKEV